MNEQTPERKEPNRSDIEAVVEKVKQLAPYEGQAVDWLGSFVTNYIYDDDIVSIYIPGLHGTVHEGDLYDDTIRVARQTPLGLENDHYLFSVKSYLIRLEYLEAEYLEDVVVYERATGRKITGVSGVDIEHAKKTVELQTLSGAQSSLSSQRLDELNSLLDSLNPSTKFFDEI